MSGIRPGPRVVYRSGYLADAAACYGVVDDSARFVGKPFTAKNLNAKMREVLAERPVQRKS